MKMNEKEFKALCKTYFPALTAFTYWKDDGELWGFFNSCCDTGIVNFSTKHNILYLPDYIIYSTKEGEFIGATKNGGSKWKDGKVIRLKDIDKDSLVEELVILQKKYKEALVKHAKESIDKDFV